MKRVQSPSARIPFSPVLAWMTVAATITVMLVANVANAQISGGTVARPTQEVHCPRNSPPGTDYVSVILDIDALKVDSNEDDPGGDYELRLLAEASVFPQRTSPTEKLTPANMICGILNGQWYAEFDIPDMVTGQYYTFTFTKRLVVHNVRRKSEVRFRLRLNEIDDWTGTDYGALDPTTGEHILDLLVFPFTEFTFVGKDGPRVHPNGIPFGQPMTVVGRGDDFWAGLAFNVTMEDQAEIVGAVPAPPKPSARETFCRNYALESVNQNQMAIGQGCAVGPPVWSNNHQAHFDWCMLDSNDSAAKIAVAERNKFLATCAQGTNPDQVCRDYADRSVAQFNAAKAKGCSVAPPVWSDAWQAHFGWCKAVGGSFATPELKKRDLYLATCK